MEMIMSVKNELNADMDKALDHLRKDLKALRTARANPSQVEGVMVEAYGTNMRLKEMASITAPEARQLLITPYDPANLHAIKKGIENANLNLQPVVDGGVIRITVPQMDESVRKEIVKEGKKKAEDAKIAIREIRRKYNEVVRKQKSSGIITEDDVKREEKMIQEMTDKFCKECDKLFTDKEKEVMAI